MNSFEVLMKWVVKSRWTRRAPAASPKGQRCLQDSVTAHTEAHRTAVWLMLSNSGSEQDQTIAQSQLPRHIMCPHFLPITLAHTFQEILSWTFFLKTPTSFIFYLVPGLQGTPSVAEGIPLYDNVYASVAPKYFRHFIVVMWCREEAFTTEPVFPFRALNFPAVLQWNAFQSTVGHCVWRWLWQQSLYWGVGFVFLLGMKITSAQRLFSPVL